MQIKACDLNGGFESNKIKVELNALSEDKPHAPQKAINNEMRVDALPGAVMEANIAGTASGSNSAGVMAAIIICSASAFIVLVMIGIYRLKK